MTFNEMKDLLLNYPTMTEKIHGIKKEIDEINAGIEALRESTKTIIITDMPKGGGISDDTYNRVQKIVDEYEKRLNKLTDDLERWLSKQTKTTDLLRDLTPDEYKVIEARYIDGIKWDFVPGRIAYSRKQCFRLHDTAINKMINQFKDGTK